MFSDVAVMTAACAVLRVLYCMHSTACAVLHTWLMLPASRALSFFAPDLPMHSELKDRKNKKIIAISELDEFRGLVFVLIVLFNKYAPRKVH